MSLLDLDTYPRFVKCKSVNNNIHLGYNCIISLTPSTIALILWTPLMKIKQKLYYPKPSEHSCSHPGLAVPLLWAQSPWVGGG